LGGRSAENEPRIGANFDASTRLIDTVPTTALIADDEEAPRAELLNALHTVWPELDVVDESVNGVDAWDAYLQHEPQVCFLDVRMPGLTGVEVAQRIGGRSHVIFVTAHGDHALAAFDAGAVDYVVKPISAERLEQAVQRVKARLAEPATEVGEFDLLDRLAGQVRRPDYLDIIEAGVGGEMTLVRIDDVVFFESEARYTRVVHDEGDALIRTPLKELLSQLDPAVFWQIHRSVIVNRRHIAGAERLADGNMVVTLHGRTEKLPVSRHFQGLFKAQ
jgi:DNA-binding LytR/AlgR family response regulator